MLQVKADLGPWRLLMLLVQLGAATGHTMYAGGSFQTVGIPGTAGIVKITTRGTQVGWSSVGHGVYSPDRASVVNAIVMLDATDQLLAGGDFVMAGAVHDDNIKNQTAAWGFAHFDGSNWHAGYKGLSMVSSDGNRVLTMLHTHVYDSSKRVWKEHVILGGKFYAQAATKFFANFAHHNGDEWVGMSGDLAPAAASLPISVVQKYGAPATGGPRDKVMIGGSNYFRFYDLQTNQLEQQCASDALNIVSLTTVCNGWVYAATDGEVGSHRFNYNDCGGIQFNEQRNSTWSLVPERSSGCPLNQISQLMCVGDSTVVAVGKFKVPGWRSATYDTRLFAKSHSATLQGRFLHTNDSGWQGQSSCCKQQESCTGVCESECQPDQQPFPELLTVAQNPGEDGTYWVAGKQDPLVAGGSAVARVQVHDIGGSEPQLLRIDTDEYRFDGPVSTIQTVSSASRSAGHLAAILVGLSALMLCRPIC